MIGISQYALKITAPFLLGAVLWIGAGAAQAHFLLNLNVRILHVDHTQDGLVVFIRTPMPYLVADRIGEAAEGELPAPAPFTTNAFEDDALVHYVDLEALEGDANGLGELANEGFTFAIEGSWAEAEVRRVRVHSLGSEPGFATLEEARLSLATSATRDGDAKLYVGDAIVDVELFIPKTRRVTRYSVSSSLDPGLPGQEETANLIIDYGSDNPQVFRSRGLLSDPVEISRSGLAAMGTFFWEGMRHILEGADHVLFVICLVIGASTLHLLLWRVTGFTVGHSVTLITGFFGFVPSAPWFVPAVETGIALSIIYAAVLAIWPRPSRTSSTKQMLLVTIAIGMLHGLGFSFVLQEILQVTSPNIWQSLLAFNVGVEAGQIAIVLVVWPTLIALERLFAGSWRATRIVAAVACTAIAGVWTVERIGQIVSAI